jgi:RNA polymerase sigma-70 factor (ECF subfamily)
LDEPPPLLPRIAAGDDSAVRECVQRYGPMLLAVATRWSPDAGEAEDAVQEIFFDLWRFAARYDVRKATERGFVAMIARRRLIDRHRQRTRRISPDAMPDGYDLPAEEPDAGDRVSDAMTAQEILALLTPPQRRFIERHLLDGKTHDEIAREANVPIGTVKSHIHRGIQKARALLAGRVSPTQEAGQ